MRWLALLLLLVPPAARAQAKAAPSDDPVPAETGKLRDERDEGEPSERRSRSGGFVEARSGGGASRLGGFDFALTTFFSSGVDFSPESYTASFSLWLEPSFALGKRWARGTWFEPLTLAVRLPVEFEATGSDPRFRGEGFSTGTLLNTPEGFAILQPQVGTVDGLVRRAAVLGDTWVNLVHGHLFTIPRTGITVASGLRTVLPTSVASRNAGLVSALSLGLILERGLGPVHLTYVFRPAKYFFTRAVPQVVGTSDTVAVNGKIEPTWRPGSTGVANPNWGFINGLLASVELPAGFSLSASYFLFNVLPFELNGCTVPGVPTANPCLDGAALSGGGTRWRNDHWFLASVDWSHGPVSLSLGLSTYRPITNTDGTVSQPFFVSNRNNFTTVYLSFSTSAEQLADAFSKEKSP